MPSHAHHAIQIVIALDGCVPICGKDDGWRESRGIVVRPDAEHSFDCNGALGVMVFVEPESSEGAWLSASLQQDITIVPFLSPTRFAHLFTDQVGLPFSRYVLWRKLTRSTVAIGSEETIAAAAHAADFADAAHLTRTFYQMVGMAPSVLMRGDFIEIASPFNTLPRSSGERSFPRPTE